MLDQALPDCARDWNPLHTVPVAERSYVAFHLVRDLWGNTCALWRLYFEATPAPWIVTRSDDHGTASFPGHRAIANDGRGCRLGTQVRLNVISGGYFGYRGGEVLGGEACVIANDQALWRETGSQKVLACRLSAYPHVVESEVLGDRSSPAVGAEFDWCLYVTPL